MMRSVLAALSAPIVYGLMCVPVNWLIVKMFPSHFDDSWVTSSNWLLALLVIGVMLGAWSRWCGQ